jgi:Beta-lactamase
VTAEDLVRFHTALRAGKLLGQDATAAMLTPKEAYKPRGAGTHYTGFAFEFEADAEGEVSCYWKEGINVGASGALSHYPAQDVTVAVLSNMENGAWEPIKTIERLVTSPDPRTQRSS